jgi:hypothetical protein
MPIALWKRRILVERTETLYSWLASESQPTNRTHSWRSCWKMEQSSTQMLWKVSAFLSSYSPPDPPPSITLSDILSRGITSFYPTPRHVLLNEHSYTYDRSLACVAPSGYSVCMSTQFLLGLEFSTHEHRNGRVGLLLRSETRVTETDAPRENIVHCLPMLNMCSVLQVDSAPVFGWLIVFILMYFKLLHSLCISDCGWRFSSVVVAVNVYHVEVQMTPQILP